jgi:hypothetical protein
MDRLEDLKSYQIMDTPPEEELNELAQIASAIFDTPVSIISFIDEERQWYKAKIGLDFNEVSIEDTFCKYTLDNPEALLIFENTEDEVLVKNHPAVTTEEGIKFYASAPLVSDSGNVLGTVCVLDYEPKKNEVKKYEALRLISKKVMDYLNMRKLLNQQNQEIEYSATRLKKLTDLAPGVIFKLSVKENKKLDFIFISDGIHSLIPGLKADFMKEKQSTILNFFFGEEKNRVIELFKQSYHTLEPIETEYKVHIPSSGIDKWHWMKANPEKRSTNETVWYGVIQDITQKKNHMSALEKMLFDISHVIRKPIANILGISDLMQDSEMTLEEKKEMCSLITEETRSLDQFINRLNSEYVSLKINLKDGWK